MQRRRSPRAPSRLLVGVFDDEVRAAQAVRGLDVWRRGRGRREVGPIGAVARRLSGGVTCRTLGVPGTGRRALGGAVAGLVLLALPAGGASAMAALAVAAVIVGPASLLGVVRPDQAGALGLAIVLAAAALGGLLAGLAGATAGSLAGLLVAFVDRRLRGLTRSEVALALSVLPPGAWAAVARAGPGTATAVRDELARLGAARDSSRSDDAGEGAPALECSQGSRATGAR